MNFYVYGGLYSFICNLIIGFFVLSRNPRSSVNIRFALFSLAISGWSVGSFLANVIPDKTTALVVIRFNYFFAVWLPSIYIHFVYTLTNDTSRYTKIKLRVAYCFSSLFSLVVFTPWFIPALTTIKATHFYISSPGPLYYFFFLFFAMSTFEAFTHTAFRLKHFKGKLKTQIFYVTIANAVAILGGFEYFSRVFGFFKIPPLDDYILLIYIMIIAYAIFKHSLMSIEDIAEAAQKNKLETLGMLSASIHHELKNPVYIIRTLSEAYLLRLQEKTFPHNEDALQKSVETCEKTIQQANRAMDIIERLAGFMRQEPAPIQPVDLRKILQDVYLFLSYEIHISNIDLTWDLPHDFPSLQAEPRSIEQIFFNLIVNACQAIKKVKIDRGVIKVSGKKTPNGVEITIEDNGPGISPNVLPKIFEPFYTTKDTGSGLGLYITKQLVEKCGGKISAASEPGKTVFNLNFKSSI